MSEQRYACCIPGFVITEWTTSGPLPRLRWVNPANPVERGEATRSTVNSHVEVDSFGPVPLDDINHWRWGGTTPRQLYDLPIVGQPADWVDAFGTVRAVVPVHAIESGEPPGWPRQDGPHAAITHDAMLKVVPVRMLRLNKHSDVTARDAVGSEIDMEEPF